MSGDLFCNCQQPNDGRFMIQCQTCEDWFHPSCAGIASSRETKYKLESDLVFTCSHHLLKQTKYCVCDQPYAGELMIECRECNSWFHPTCIGLSKRTVWSEFDFECALHASETNSRYTTSKSVLYTDGCTVLKSAVTVTSLLTQKMNVAMQKSNYIIFNDNAISVNDRLRSSAPIELAVNDVKGFDKVLEFINVKHANLTWVVLDSKKGCQRQAAHADYDKVPTRSKNSHRVSYSCLLAVQDDTHIDVWRGAHLLTDFPVRHSLPRETINLQKGDVFIFRADCIHAGSEYNRSNRRLHCYVDIPGMPHTLNHVIRWWNLLPGGVLQNP
jgi:hypothetical protein